MSVSISTGPVVKLLDRDGSCIQTFSSAERGVSTEDVCALFQRTCCLGANIKGTLLGTKGDEKDQLEEIDKSLVCCCEPTAKDIFVIQGQIDDFVRAFLKTIQNKREGSVQGTSGLAGEFLHTTRGGFQTTEEIERLIHANQGYGSSYMI